MAKATATSEARMARTAAEILERQLVVNHLIPMAAAWYHLSGYVRGELCINADIPMTVARNEWAAIAPTHRDKLHAAFMVWCDPKGGGKWT